ncbi:calponin 3 [Rhinolophus ferrumequinum]|uniref:Calponin 3 n=1 Tax=Rhinolophus ferrumequinum TaxID=59479 RepID=A0A7J7SW50_RHIFE|nr:calponin 3 [Rhinolophus ferrumequinum]
MTHFNKGPSYGLSAEVKNKIASKYDHQAEEDLRNWIEEVTGMSIGTNFQLGLKDGIILCELINKLQPGSVKKVNESSLNWPQLENIGNFIKAIQAYGMKPHDIFEANDLFENGNMTQVQTTLVALAGLAKTKGFHTTIDIGVKYAEKQTRRFDEGMSVYGLGRQVYDPKYCAAPTEPVIHNGSQGTGTNGSEISDSDYQAEYPDEYHGEYQDDYPRDYQYGDQGIDY